MLVGGVCLWEDDHAGGRGEHAFGRVNVLVGGVSAGGRVSGG